MIIEKERITHDGKLKDKTRLEPPGQYQVVMTQPPGKKTCSFCLLTEVFNMPQSEALEYERAAFEKGRAVVLVTVKDIAEQKSSEANVAASAKVVCRPIMRRVSFVAERQP